MRKRLPIAIILILIIAAGFLLPGQRWLGDLIPGGELILKASEFVPVALISFLGVISIRELAKMFQPAQIDVSRRVSILIVSMLILLAWFRWMEMALPVVGLVVILGFLWRMFRDPIQGSWTDISVTCATSLYVGMPIALMIDLYLQGDAGKTWLAFMLVTVWSTDIGAYFAGKKFGKKKLYPRLSPRKTVEGAVGGMMAALLSMLVFYICFPGTIGQTTPLVLVVFTVFLTILIIIGDMAESLLKREAGVKDSGHLLPGHGGALDRMDSMLFVCIPFVLFLRLMHPLVFAN